MLEEMGYPPNCHWHKVAGSPLIGLHLFQPSGITDSSAVLGAAVLSSVLPSR